MTFFKKFLNGPLRTIRFSLLFFLCQFTDFVTWWITRSCVQCRVTCLVACGCVPCQRICGFRRSIWRQHQSPFLGSPETALFHAALPTRRMARTANDVASNDPWSLICLVTRLTCSPGLSKARAFLRFHIGQLCFGRDRETLHTSVHQLFYWNA